MPKKKKTKPKYKAADPRGWTRKELIASVNELTEELARVDGVRSAAEQQAREAKRQAQLVIGKYDSLDEARNEFKKKYDDAQNNLRAESFSLQELKKGVLGLLSITDSEAQYGVLQVVSLLKHELGRRDVTIESLQNELLRRNALS